MRSAIANPTLEVNQRSGKMLNVVEFLSATFLTGAGLVLPVCIVVSIVRAIRAIGQHHDEPTR
jgi:hypothetical protein